jgi:hypothetical protein
MLPEPNLTSQRKIWDSVISTQHTYTLTLN